MMPYEEVTSYAKTNKTKTRRDKNKTRQDKTKIKTKQTSSRLDHDIMEKEELALRLKCKIA